MLLQGVDGPRKRVREQPKVDWICDCGVKQKFYLVSCSKCRRKRDDGR